MIPSLVTASIFDDLSDLKIYFLCAIPFVVLIVAAVVWVKTKSRPDRRMSLLLTLVLVVTALLAVKGVFFDGL